MNDTDVMTKEVASDKTVEGASIFHHFCDCLNMHAIDENLHYNVNEATTTSCGIKRKPDSGSCPDGIDNSERCVVCVDLLVQRHLLCHRLVRSYS